MPKKQRQLPKTHDRLPEVRASIERYRTKYKNNNHYSIRGEDRDEIEVLQLADVPDDVLDAVEGIGAGMDSTLSIFLDIITIIHNHPRVLVAHILDALNITKSTYYGITKPAVVSDFIMQLRRTVIEADVIEAGLVLRGLLRDDDARVRFSAAKFILENNGQMYGYRPKDDTTNNAIKIVLEDKRVEKQIYNDDDLTDV